MRTRFLSAVLLLLPVAAAAQAPGTLDVKSRADLLATRETAWRAWFSGDRATLETMLPAEFIGIGWGEGPWSDRAASLAASEGFASGGGKLTLLEFPRTEIQVYGDVAVVYSEYRVSFTADGQVVDQAGRATEVFVKRGGRWLHPAWHLDSGK